MVEAGPLALVDEEFTPAQGAAVGGGGLRRFRFQASSAGSGRLQLQLGREWESAPTRRVAVAITVEG